MSENHRDNTRRIAKNTIFLYGRMLLGMLVSLYTSRVVLQALGVEDFGIYNVVGGFVSMFSLISSALSSSISRFLTFELGKNNQEKLKEIFSTSLLIQILIGALVLVIAETLGVWFVNNKMVIPLNRIYSANCVFQASVFGFIFGLISTPYNAVIIAHEKMDIYAYFGIMSIFINLGIILFIAYSPLMFDRLVMYSILILSASIAMQIIYWLYCHRNFPESRVRPAFYKKSWMEMSGFAGWNTIGCTAGILKDQGINILLNLFFGPIVNASRGIAGSVSNAVGQFTSNFMTALNPQITKSYASGDHQYMLSLVERGSRFGYYIMLILSIPVILETPFILSLWLKEYPENTVIFVRLVLIASLIEVLSNTLITLQVATGKIRNYQIAVGGLLLLNFPLSWLVLRVGGAPYTVYIIAIGIGIGCLLLRLWFLRYMVGLSMRRYLRKVVGNVIVTTACAVIFPLGFYMSVQPGFLRLFIVVLTGFVSAFLSILFVGCTAGERIFIRGKIFSLKSRFVSAPV